MDTLFTKLRHALNTTSKRNLVILLIFAFAFIFMKTEWMRTECKRSAISKYDSVSAIMSNAAALKVLRGKTTEMDRVGLRDQTPFETQRMPAYEGPDSSDEVRKGTPLFCAAPFLLLCAPPTH